MFMYLITNLQKYKAKVDRLKMNEIDKSAK